MKQLMIVDSLQLNLCPKLHLDGGIGGMFRRKLGCWSRYRSPLARRLRPNGLSPAPLGEDAYLHGQSRHWQTLAEAAGGSECVSKR